MKKEERRYRRLLSWYPRDHRDRNSEEMLGVLLADARDERGPRWRQTADLLWGAVRLHLRRVVAVDGGVDPRDVLATVSLLAPVMMLAGAGYEMYALGFWAQRASGSDSWTYFVPDIPLWTIWLVVAVLAVVGLRRVAAVGAWLGTAGFVVATVVSLQDSWSLRWWTGADAGWVLLGALTAVALTWSPGPARGREVVGRWAIAVMAGSVVVTLLFDFLAGWSEILSSATSAVLQSMMLALLIVGAVVAAGPRSRVGRRAALLLLLPAMTIVPVAIAAMGFVPHVMLTLTAAEVAAVEAVAFGALPVVVVLLTLGVLPHVMRRTRKPVA